MAYIITITKYPPGGNPMPSGQEKYATFTTSEDELKRTLFNAREGDTLSLQETRILEVIAGRAHNPIYDGTRVEVTYWGPVQAVNWMVEHGYDPATENFIDAFNKDQRH